jgi:integrase/recombinase XerC
MELMKSQAETYIDFLRFQRYSPENTVVAKQQDLKKVYALCLKKKVSSWVDFTPTHLRELVASELKAGRNPKSVNRLLTTVRTLFKHLKREGYVQVNPADDFQGPKEAQNIPTILAVEECSQMLDAEVDGFLGYRDQAILELFYSAALRLSELVGLTMDKLNLKEGYVRVVGKGNKERLVPVGGKASEALVLWLQHRSGIKAQDNNVFLSHHGKALTQRAVQKRVKAFGQQTLGKDLHPHILRHSCATHLLQSTQNLRAVQEILGHKNIATTQIYTHLDLPYMQGVHKSHPRG